MTSRERMIATLEHRQPDRTPYQVAFTLRAREAIAAHCGDPDFDRDLDNAVVMLGAEPRVPWREVEPDIWEDQFGVRWNRSIDKDIGNVCNLLVTPDNVDDYVFPDLDDATRFEDYVSTIEAHPDRFFVSSIGFSLYERAWTLAGMTEFLQYMVTSSEFAHRLLDSILEWNLGLIDRACRYPIDAMRFGDDWGMQTGLIMGPDLWREFIGPRVHRMYQRCHDHGKHVFIHSCGKVDELFDDLIDAGVDVFNPFQPEVIDVFEAKRRYGDRLTFYGGISTQVSLPFKSPEEVKAEVRALLDKVGRNGGYIAAPAHAIPGGVKPENYFAMMEVLNNQ
mgnify:CR=1 FL=1